MKSPIFIVVAVCNFDDVILGAWHNLSVAVREAKRCDKNPELRFRADHQATDTEYLWAVVYRATGKVLEKVWTSEPPPAKKKAKQS